MEGLWSPVLWGSPVGMGIFFAGLGVLLWGVGKLPMGATDNNLTTRANS